jgi:hypothetical protein
MNQLTHHEHPAVIMANSQAQKGVDARGRLKYGLAQSPAPEIRGFFESEPDVTPEIVKIVFLEIIMQIIVLRNVALQPARSEIFDQEVIDRLVKGWDIL